MYTSPHQNQSYILVFKPSEAPDHNFTASLETHEMAMGSQLSTNCSFLPLEELLTMEAKMGRNRVVVAILLVHSVITEITLDKIKVMTAGFTELKGSIFLAIHSESPEV